MTDHRSDGERPDRHATHEPPRPEASPPSTRIEVGRGGPRWPLIGVGALAAIAAVLALAVFLDPREGSGDASPSPPAAGSATPGPSASAAASSSATPRAVPATAAPSPSASDAGAPSGAAPLGWREATAPDGDVHTVEWMADRWVAAGRADLAAAAWTSADGLTWTASAPIPPEPIRMTPEGDPGTGYWVSELVAYGDELIALGWNRIGCCDGGRPMAWRSADGATWSVVETEGTAFDVYQSPTSAAVAPDGTLVVVSGIDLGSRTSVFTTRDLVSWERHDVTQAAFETMQQVAASPTMLLAVGGSGGGDRSQQRAWTSTDGRTWTAVSPPSDLGTLSAVAWDPTHERFLVAGQDDELRATVWLTADGSAWTSVELTSGGGVVNDLSVVGRLIVATGSSGTPEEADVMAWSSFDGITWQIAELGPAAGGVPVGAAGARGAVVLVSSLGPEPDYLPIRRAWLGTR